MVEEILSIDRIVFLMINHLPHTWWSDWAALVLSGVGSAGLIWICIGTFFFFREEKKDHRFFIPIAFTLVSCGVFVEGLLKYLIHRPRPSVLEGAYLVGSAGWFSMPSSHAAISWAMAVIFSRYEHGARWVWYVLALGISLSRIYLGMHYPTDVLVGGCIGWGIGTIAVHLHSYPMGSKKKRPQGEKRNIGRNRY